MIFFGSWARSCQKNAKIKKTTTVQHFRKFFDVPGLLLEAMLGYLGAMLGHLGAMLAYIGASWSHLGTMLEQLGNKMGPKSAKTMQDIA